MKYTFRTDARQTLIRAGLRQADMARLAKVGQQDLNKKLLRRKPTLELWARRVARAFAESEKIDAQAAFDLLFEVYVEDGSEPH